jgi:Xaa-Pro dipeptidase
VNKQSTIEKATFFSDAEYQRRLAATRNHMAERGLETLLVFNAENVVYLSGYQSIGYSSYLCLVVPSSGDLTLYVREMETGCAYYYAWVNDITFYADHHDPVAILYETLQQRNLTRGTIGLEMDAAFIGAKRMLQIQDLIQKGGAVATDGSGCVEQVRMIKSAEEIAYIRKACRATEAGILAGVRTVRTGVTENQIAAAMFDATVGAGSTYMSSQPIVTSGPRSGVAHTTFDNRIVQEGDVVLLELGGCVNRYSGGLMRSVAVGKVPDEVHRMAVVCREALEAAIDAIKPGIPAGIPDAKCVEVITHAGYEPNFRKRTGYSVGVSFPPDWGEGHIISIRHGEQALLEPGMVFHMPPALRILGRWGVGTSETVMVSDTGCEVLTQGVSRDLFVKP